MSWAMYDLWKFCAHLMWYMLITWFCWNPVFHFLVLCSSQSGDHPERSLANFHYTPYMKWFFLKRDPSMIWLLAGDLEKTSSKSTETHQIEVSPFMAWQFKKRQQSSVNLGHKFPCMGWNSILQVTIGQKFVAGRIPGETYSLQGIRETKLIHQSFKRQLVLWEEMPTYIPLKCEYSIFTTFI
jgi:hypothetical protein